MKTIFKNCLIKAEFTNELKLVDITPRKNVYNLRIAGLLVFYPVSQKSLKESYTGREVYMLIGFYRFLYVAIEKALGHSKHYCKKDGKTLLIKLGILVQYLWTF